MKVAVVGQGYVGLPLAIAAAESGYEVIGIDNNQALISSLSDGISPIGDISDAQVAKVISTDNYKVTTNFSEISSVDVVVVCVPTPLNSAHRPDLSYVESAFNEIAKYLADGALVINESTVAPGTTRSLIARILEESGKTFDLAYSPERIDPANKVWNVKNTPKLVAGLTESATERAMKFYGAFVETITPGSSVEVIETAKLLENSFRLINISFINEIAQFCNALGIDAREVINAAATKPYGFMPFYPSAGVGGHCIPVDPMYLADKASEIGTPSKFIDLAHEINQGLPHYFATTASNLLDGLANKRILLVGVAYKPGVADTRETPALGLITALRDAGANVSWHDDLVLHWNNENSTALSDQFDLAILLNPHPHCDLTLLGQTPVLNTRGGN